MNAQVLTTKQVIGDQNCRYGLLPDKVAMIKASIVSQGEIMVPLEVYPIEKGMYRVNDGHYRLAAAQAIETEQPGTVVDIPVVVVAAPAENEPARRRLIRQIAFNRERADMSLMDTAIAMKALFEDGVSRKEICSVFARSGGKKGAVVMPCSNAYLNVCMSFNDFPKKIRDLIHVGVIPYTSAYRLTTKPKSDWDDIVAGCEKEVADALALDTRLEEKYLESIKKEEDAKVKASELQTQSALVVGKIETAQKAVETAQAVEVAAYAEQRKGAKDEKEKEAKAAAFLAAQTDTKVAQKALAEVQKEAEKLKAKREKMETDAADRAKKLAELRKASANKAKITDKAVDRKAAEVAKAKGGASQQLKLSPALMRAALDKWALPGGGKVMQIARIMQNVWDGGFTPSQAFAEMQIVVDEDKKSKVATKA